MEECPSAETLEKLATGKLDANEHDTCLRHTEKCRPCELTLYEFLLRAKPEETNLQLKSSTPSDARSQSPAAHHGSEDSWKPPSTLRQFRVHDRIGRGGMGVVYLGVDMNLDRKVAIKFVSASSAKPQESDARIAHEARIVAQLKHPNIVTLLQVDQFDGRPYLIYEYVSGRTLAQKKLPLDWRETAHIGATLAKALSYAHEQGVFHRDIKPSNLMEDGDGTLKIVDFGLAKTAWAERDRETSQPGDLQLAFTVAPAALRDLSLTRTGRALGTPGYIAPEIMNGQPASAQSDLYSLGVVLYLLCTGHHPFPSTLLQPVRVFDVPPAKPLRSMRADLPPRFAETIERCLASLPSDRFDSAAELAKCLDGILNENQAGLGAAITTMEAAPAGRLIPRILLPMFGSLAFAALAFGAPNYGALWNKLTALTKPIEVAAPALIPRPAELLPPGIPERLSVLVDIPRQKEVSPSAPLNALPTETVAPAVPVVGQVRVERAVKKPRIIKKPIAKKSKVGSDGNNLIRWLDSDAI